MVFTEGLDIIAYHTILHKETYNSQQLKRLVG